MMNYKERYHNDPAFQQIVDMMTHMILQGDFSPSEIRLASMVASIRAETMNLTRTRIYPMSREIEETFDKLHEQINKETTRGD